MKTCFRNINSTLTATVRLTIPLISLSLLIGVASCLEMEARNGGLLTIGKLKESYAVNEPILFQVNKNAAGPVLFACAAEVLVDGAFHEIRWDISKNALKLAFRRPTRMDSETMEVKWDIPHQMRSIRPEAGNTYRLRIDILSPRQEQIYSTSFFIREK